jgi:hypothetical protein
MSSSTSSSEPLGTIRSATDWAGFTRAFLAVAILSTAALLAVAFLIDPYDTGRSPLALKDGVRPQGPRMAAASRGRDPAFRGAIFGNSHIQLISPEELRRLTGTPFVSLITPATGPKETLALIEWFLRHRREPAQAIVIGIDSHWCTPDPALPNKKPFPFWLLSRSAPDYLFGLMRFEVIEELARRIAFLTSKTAARARPDGYWDYEAGYSAQGYDSNPAIRARLQARTETGGGNVTGPFPAASELEALMQTAPAETALILVRPPVYVTALPAPGSTDAAADAACCEAFAALAARRPRTSLVDWRIDRPELRDPNQFFDHSHYRRGIARLVEADIAAALTALR